MRPHKLTVILSLCLILLFTFVDNALGQRKPPAGGRLAIVVDERLAALRSSPDLIGKLVRRLSRGRLVAVTGMKTSADGIIFYRVNVTSRTRGWIQRESVVSASRPGDDERLLKLIQTSNGFDRMARCRIFLDHFRHSRLRPTVLLLLGDTAEDLANKLSAQAQRKLNNDLTAAPEFSYFLNYSGLDRYNRLGIHFTFNPTTRRFQRRRLPSPRPPSPKIPGGRRSPQTSPIVKTFSLTKPLCHSQQFMFKCAYDIKASTKKKRRS
jgi:hypothetical protein